MGTNHVADTFLGSGIAHALAFMEVIFYLGCVCVCVCVCARVHVCMCV
jgi:hypothetical protein